MNEKIIINVIGHIPLKWRRFLAVIAARLFFYLSPKHRLITLHNIMRAFPDRSMQDSVRLAKKSYESFLLVVADFFDIPHINKENLYQWIRVEGLSHYTEACNEGKGVLIFGGHFGNWEIGNAALAILTRPFVFIYRVLDSPLLERGITGVRASYGNTSLSKENAMRPMIRLLKGGSTINLLIDQNVAWHEGVFVDFFGRKACTTSGLALLALHTKAPVLPVFTHRLPDGRYVLNIERKIDIVSTGNRDADVHTNTQNFTRIIEDQIRTYPEEWFWVHQRWKTRPCQVKQKGQ